MSLYLQHGYGKSTRITDAYNDGSATGVIFSPRNEKIDKLNDYIAELRSVGRLDLMLDPQFHISTVSPPKDRYLPDDYGYYQAGRTTRDFTSALKIQKYARETLDFQHVMDVDRLVSPTVIVSTFSDRWSQIALQLADASCDHHGGMSSPKPLLYGFGRLNDVLSGVGLDAEITKSASPESSDWNERLAERHHWQTLANTDSTFGTGVRSNVGGLLARVAYAQSLYSDLESIGVRFSRNCNGDHLPDWDEALNEFVRIATP